MKTILSKHLLFLFLLAAAFLTASTGICYHSVHTLRANQAAVTHTYDVLGSLESIRAALATAEGNQRNYLFTAQDEYLTLYGNAAQQATAEVQQLASLVADSPAQHDRAAALAQLTADRLAALVRGLEEHTAGGTAAAQAWTANGPGRGDMDAALQLIATMQAEEHHLLADRSAQSDSSLRRLVVTFSLVGLLSVGLLAVIFLTVRQEVATRAAASRQLKESETRMLLAVEAAELGIWEHDLLAHRIVASDRCRIMFGLPIDQPVTPDNFSSRLHPDDRERFLATVHAAIQPDGPGEFAFEYRVLWPDGTLRWIRSRGRAVLAADRRSAIRLVGTMVDITDPKRAAADLLQAKDKAESANRAKDQFLAVLSHELRTPLTPVLAAVSELEQRPELPAGVRDDVSTIRRNIELEARLIDDLLDLTRIARGKIQLHPEIVDLHTLTAGVLDMFRAQARDKNLTLTLDLSAPQHHAWADPGRLQQLLWNLCSNALKFTPPHGTITVRTRNEGSGNKGDAIRFSSSLNPDPLNPEPSLVLEVSDTGIGIEPAALPRLFNAFEQGEQTISRKFGGLGLGLSIAKTIADLHGGQLLAQSPGRNQGTTFRLTLPTPHPPTSPSPHLPPSPLATSNQQRATSLKILLVEDNEDTRRLMGRLLRTFGHQVEAADCVAAALALANNASFDLLVSDIGLPDGTGWDLMQLLADRRPPKAIALSGFGMEDDLRRSHEAGFLEHITKPVNITELRDTITRIASTP